jgi:coatomer protein complex subunit epsilon
MASPPDHLFGLRNSFYIGAYHAAITSSQSVPAHALSPDDVIERDALLYRSYIAIGSHQVRAGRAPTAVGHRSVVYGNARLDR